MSNENAKTFAGLCEDFIQSEKFKTFAPATQELWARELDFACRPGCLGAVSTDAIRPALIQGYLDGWTDKPGKQAVAKAAFKAVEKWAVVRDLLARPITLGVETGKSSGGHIPWSDGQVRQAEKVCRTDLASAITLAASTGQRISDLVRMCWTDIRLIKGRSGIDVTQKKTGRKLWIPFNDELCETLETWERRPGPILLRETGEPWDSRYLTDRWDYEKRIKPELAEHKNLGLVLHGLRGHCCVRLSRGGLTDHQISDIVGMSSPMVARYTRLSSQEENALAAIDRTLDERRRLKGGIEYQKSSK